MKLKRWDTREIIFEMECNKWKEHILKSIELCYGDADV